MELCGKFQKMDAVQIDDAIGQLREITGDSGKARTEYEPMNEEQVASLHSDGLIEIGAHTRFHVNLAALSAEKQKTEIEGSKRDLEELLGSQVNNFSYPFGTLNHFSDLSVKLVKKAGFHSAVTTYPGNMSRLSSSYRIPRRAIRNWNGDIFEKALEQYYSGVDQIDA
jgi:peptidoglycan/xylan/chitin deacetylase (PgdA/CDA1 family)